MTEINLHNYEAFLLDLAEGRLSDEQRLQLQAFLLANPGLEADIDSFDLPSLAPEEVKFSGDALLYKDLPDEAETEVLSYLEGLMDPDTRKAFESKLADDARLQSLVAGYSLARIPGTGESFPDSASLYPDLPDARETEALAIVEGLNPPPANADSSLRQLIAAYTRTRITADMKVVYPDKESLLRKAKVVRFPVPVFARVAAGLLLIFTLVVLLWPSDEGRKPVAKVPELRKTPAIKKGSVTREPAKAVPGMHAEQQVAERKAPVLNKSVPSQVKKTMPGKEPAVAEPVFETPAAHEMPVAKAGSSGAAEMVPSSQSPSEPVNDAVKPVITDLSKIPLVSEEELVVEEKSRFWERAAGVVTHLRKLGVKRIDAEQREEGLTLSLSSLTVEKKYAGL